MCSIVFFFVFDEKLDTLNNHQSGSSDISY